MQLNTKNTIQVAVEVRSVRAAARTLRVLGYAILQLPAE